MERKNQADLLFSRAIEQRFERARRTQFNINIFRVRQKSREQITAFLERQTSHSAFARIARGDDDRRAEAVDILLELVGNFAKTIEPKFEKIRWLLHRERESKIGRRR